MSCFFKKKDRDQFLRPFFKRCGFTLIELMIVMAIIGILAGIAVPKFTQFRNRAYNAAALSDAQNAKIELQAYYAEWAHYPY